MSASSVQRAVNGPSTGPTSDLSVCRRLYGIYCG